MSDPLYNAVPPGGYAPDADDLHECVEDDTCICRQDAAEPDEKCPVHGAGEWPPRCSICGKFIKGA